MKAWSLILYSEDTDSRPPASPCVCVERRGWWSEISKDFEKESEEIFKISDLIFG